MSERLYYIQDTRTYFGDTILWWGPNRGGYTCKLAEAGLYSEEEAERIFHLRGTDVPVLQEDAERAARPTVMVGDLRKVQEAANRLPFGPGGEKKWKFES